MDTSSSTPTTSTTADVNPTGRWATALLGDANAWCELASSYWYCVYAWWRRMGKDALGAEAATVANFTCWIEARLPQAEDPGAARMREWIPARLMLFEAADLESSGAPAIEIDPAWAEQRYADEPPGEADTIFQRRWALTMLEFTSMTLRDEYTARGEQALFDELLSFGGFEAGEEERYAAAASRTGRSVGAMRKAVFDFRTRQRQLLRAFAADTVFDPSDADSELTALMCAVDSASSAVADPDDSDAPPAATPAVPTILRKARPDEVFARAMQTVRMTSGGNGIWTPPSDEEIARLFPQYEMLGILGRGGMGAVYKGRQVALDRFVAIKLLPLEVSVDKDFADRFVREARAMAKLSHPNIIAVYDFGTTSEGHLYFVMEFIEGANLADMIHKAGLPPERTLELAGQICTALAYAHSKGIVHRDIKPANVMVSLEGAVKVADFGLARLTDPGTEQLGHTMTGTVMGTPDYMAPEQKRGMNVDHRADIYSVGVMLYEMLCKETPQGAFEPPSQRVGCDPRLDPIVIKAMNRDPEKRYQSTTEMKADVDAAQTPLPKGPKARAVAKSPAAGATSPAATPAGKKPVGLFIGIGVGVLALAGAGLFLMKGKSTPQTASASSASTPALATQPPAATPTPASQPSSKTAAPAAAKPGDARDGWQDALALVDLTRDDPKGIWKRDGHSLKIPGGVEAGCLIPVEPTPQYDLRLRIRREGNPAPINVHVNKDGHSARFVIDLSAKNPGDPRLGGGLWRTDAKAAGKIVDSSAWLQDGQFHELILQIRDDGLLALLDGGEIYRWRGKWADLSGAHPFEITSYKAKVTVEDISWRPVTGEQGRTLATKPAESKPTPAPAAVAVGHEKWVDGLAQWFGGTKTNEDWVRQADGTAKAGPNGSGITPVLASVPLFRDQVARARYRVSGNEAGEMRLYVRRSPVKRDDYFLTLRGQFLVIGYDNSDSGKYGLYLQTFSLPADFDFNAVHTLELRAVGDLLTASLDGKKVGEKRDSQFADGHPAISGHNVTIESFEYANLNPTGSVAPATTSAPAAVAAGHEKWVDGLAQWFGGTKTNDEFVRENNGGARVGGTGRSLEPIPKSAPVFRDQVVRMRWHGANSNADVQLYVRLQGPSYHAGIKPAKEAGWKVRVEGGNPSKVLENRDWPLPADFKIEASHTTELRVVGDQITASVDGQKVAEVRDSTLAAGHPAFSGHDVVIESFEYANLDPAGSTPAPAPAAVAVGHEKWVDGLAQWFGGKQTWGGFDRENNGGARVGNSLQTLEPIPPSTPAFRDQVVRVRARLPAGKGEGELRLSVRSVMAPERKRYFLIPQVWEQKVTLAYDDTTLGKGAVPLTSFPLPADFDSKAVHTLELRVVGDLLSASLDGKKIGEMRDGKFAAGHPGLRAQNMVIESFEYANLDPAGAVAAASSPAKPGEVRTLGGHRYEFLEGPFIKDDASAAAKSLGGHLVTITSAAEQAWLEATFADLIGAGKNGLCRTGGDGYGASPIGWTDGEPWSYTNWAAGFPTADSGTRMVVLTKDGNKCPWRTTYWSMATSAIVEWDDDGTAKPATAAGAAPSDVLTFGGHRYQLVQELLTWDAAKAKAEAMGGHLATITSKEENEWIMNNVKLPPKEGHFFIGGSRDPKDKAATWKWVTGEPLDMGLWGGKGPDTPNADALTVMGLQWDDVHKKDTYFFLVEWDDAGPAKPASAASPQPASTTPSIFGGHRYQLVKETGLTLSEVKARAESMGGHLATITSKEEDDFVRSLLKDIPAAEQFFLGAHYESAGQSGWVWFTGEPFTYTALSKNDSSAVQGSGITVGNRNPGEPVGWLVFRDVERKNSVSLWVQGFLVEWDDAGPTKPTTAASPQPASTTNAAAATKEHPFENTLGMKFVPVPIVAGLGKPQGPEHIEGRVLFSIWDTRVQDYEVFVKETKREWKKAESDQGPTHPAVMVGVDDAQAFCAWLTARERQAGKLGATDAYRLPSDHEWSCAAGIGEQEDAAKLPNEKDRRLQGVYPWGNVWPPPVGAGNYAGEEMQAAVAAGKYTTIKELLADYNDGFVDKSPVGRFASNRFGLYDLGGNVVQWCEGAIDKQQKDRIARGEKQKGGVARGASFAHGARDALLSSRRVAAGGPYPDIGFRIVLATAKSEASGSAP